MPWMVIAQASGGFVASHVLRKSRGARFSVSGQRASLSSRCIGSKCPLESFLLGVMRIPDRSIGRSKEFVDFLVQVW